MKLVALAAVIAGVIAQDNGDSTYGFGREPTEEEIKALDIDVMPDGTGLPPGEGTVEKGRELYYQLCAACHGVTGTEGPNDVLVGREPRDGFPFGRDPSLQKTIGNYWPYATTIYDYTYRAMPFDAPGSLKPDEVYSIVAFLLNMNELIEEDVVIDANTLPEVQMPARDRFVPDDRTGGPELK
jgi:cytochrome c